MLPKHLTNNIKKFVPQYHTYSIQFAVCKIILQIPLITFCFTITSLRPLLFFIYKPRHFVVSWQKLRIESICDLYNEGEK